MSALRKTALLMAATALSSPAVHGTGLGGPRAMNREDYLHDVASNPRKYRRKDRPSDSELADMARGFKSLNENMSKRDAELVETVKKMAGEIAANGKASTDTVTQLKAISEDSTKLGQRMIDLEQKLQDNADRQKQSTQERAKSLGFRLIESEEHAAWLKQKGGRLNFNVKSITSATTGSGGAGDLIRADRIAQIILPQDRLLTIRDLLSSGRTASNAVEYVQETGFTNNAAPVAETTQKPESNIDFQLKSVPVRTIAHWFQASKQVLDDAPQLQSLLDDRLRYGLKIEEENQLLAGDGTGQNLLGLIPQAAAYNRPASATLIDVIRRAITQVRLAEYRADGVVMNPVDWEEIELTKTTQGEYVWANPRGLLSPTIWGLNVVDTQAIAADHFLVGAFKLAAIVWDREDANVLVSTEDRDNFIKNMVTIRGEERLALAVWRPEALVTGAFAANITG